MEYDQKYFIHSFRDTGSNPMVIVGYLLFNDAVLTGD
jgi:hypothetical protein